MDTVGDQRRGVRGETHEYLRGAQREVDGPADKGHLAGRLATLGALLMNSIAMLDMWHCHQGPTQISRKVLRRSGMR